ncbi:Com family DNA-binding transcriptional regulator [Azorhizobium caulinodans]|uniref:Com family DNA-binding transcriptional regulator n=1 Tax=Azorhizobium caulinodans TaxID=7 RepID=UPI0009D66825
MENIRCGTCRALLFRAGRNAISGVIEIKCRRCGTLNALRPQEPTPERPERPHPGDASCSSTAKT